MRRRDYFNKGSCIAMGKCLLKVFQPIKVKLWLSSVSAEILSQIIGGMDALTGVSLENGYQIGALHTIMISHRYSAHKTDLVKRTL